jgi:hypothetical protein
MVAFPLPCENRMAPADRVLHYLDSAICHGWGDWPRDKKKLLRNCATYDYDTALREGVTLSSAVKVRKNRNVDS